MARGAQDITALLHPEALTPGMNVLISGPVMTGKRRLLFSLLARASDAEDGAILTTTRKPGETVVREFKNADPADRPAERLRVIDCVGRQNGHDPEWKRRFASDPGDLTGIGIGLTEFMREYHHADRDAVVGLHSLSTMLMYADLRRVFQFLHVITGRISNSGFTGGFVLDDATTGEDTSILRQPFDAMLEVRETEDGNRQLRARGADIAPRRWTDFPE